jgi:hypothetical protein
LAITFSLLHAGHPLWWENGSVICNEIAHWLESHRTHTYVYILLSHLRLSQPGGPGPPIYITQEQDSSVTPPGTGFNFVASYDSQGYGGSILISTKSQSQSHVMTDDQSVSMSRFQVHSGTCDQMLYSVSNHQ